MLPSGRYQIKESGSTLDITAVQHSDEGNYVCTGTNSIKSTPHTIYVKVEGNEGGFVGIDEVIGIIIY